MKNRVGEKFITNKGYNIEIVEYFGAKNCSIKFNDGLILKNIQYDKIKRGKIANPHHRSVYNIGYLGVGNYESTINGIPTRAYKAWSKMMTRSYDKSYQKKGITYINCKVDLKWHNFQNFAKWFESNYINGYVLDKDILIKGNKLYSEHTCCFVPQELNNLFVKRENDRGKYPIGVSEYKGKFTSKLSKYSNTINLGLFDTPILAFDKYKEEKEKYIKELAIDYLKAKRISFEVYFALMNYKVDITD